jgi:MOSC domain-containing protein YiiM
VRLHTVRAMAPPGRIVSINVSGGGVPKRPVSEATVSPDGVAGDRQADRRFHGGPDRAVSLLAAEVIEALAAEGHPIAPGTTGENLTVAGLVWPEIVPGVELLVGATRLVVTRFAAPCSNIGASFAAGRFVRLSQQLHPGWSRVYARVLEPAVVKVGDPVVVSAPAAADA